MPLYLFPCPLSDVAPAEVLPAGNIELIGRISHFIVENVRSARRFLKRCNRDIDIDALTFSVLNVDTDPAEVGRMLMPLERGESIGVISEAGCPAVADPGALAVAEAQRRGLPVVPMVGPSSILLGLMASGFNGQSFVFHGYLPIDPSERIAAIRRLYEESRRYDRTQIFIETPYRNGRMLDDLLKHLPPQARLCVAADLTGPAQSIISRTVAQWRRIERPSYDKIPAVFLIYH